MMVKYLKILADVLSCCKFGGSTTSSYIILVGCKVAVVMYMVLVAISEAEFKHSQALVGNDYTPTLTVQG